MIRIDHFKILALFYDRGRKKYDSTKLIELLDLTPSAKILDVGGGTGRVASQLCPIAQTVIVADRSMDMLLKTRGKQGIQAVCSLSEKLPYPNNYFDGEIIIDALHHVENQKTTISEMWRVLKPGGKIVIEEVDITKIKGKIIEFLEKLLLMRSNFLKTREIFELFNSYKFESQITKDKLSIWVLIKKL